MLQGEATGLSNGNNSVIGSLSNSGMLAAYKA
ncbi:hypothetical protein GGI1_24466 [Acidithiobacillus sp. GGI-221]|nr:hypothetical protein GGI1_24466 [Acidithiobacillus sp. GGI-221]